MALFCFMACRSGCAVRAGCATPDGVGNPPGSSGQKLSAILYLDKLPPLLGKAFFAVHAAGEYVYEDYD